MIELDQAPQKIKDAIGSAAGTEHGGIDRKAPMRWDGGPTAAALSKDIAAFANSQDGGFLVIGMPEDDAVPSGLDVDQAASFDTTQVANWINSRFQPQIKLACWDVNTPIHGRLCVIEVFPFTGEPHLCVKVYTPDGEKKPTIRQGALYVRSDSAESIEVQRRDDLQKLLNQYFRNRRDELTAHLNAILDPSRRQPPLDTNLLWQELQHRLTSGGTNIGHWMFGLINTQADHASLLPQDVLNVAQGAIVLSHDSFPARKDEFFVRPWGAFADNQFETQAAVDERLSVVVSQAIREDGHDWRNPWKPNRIASLAKGEWLDFELSMRRFVHFFVYAARIAEHIAPESRIDLRVSIAGLSKQRIVTTNSHLWFDPTHTGIDDRFEWKRSHGREEFISDWPTIATGVLEVFFATFPGDRLPIGRETIRHWVDTIAGIPQNP